MYLYVYTGVCVFICQGSPKCSIVGGDKIEVRGEIGASRRVWGHAPPENCISCIFRALSSGKRNLFVSIVDTFNVVPKIKWIQNLQPA